MSTIKDVFVAFRQSLVSLYGVKESEAITLLAVSEVCKLSKAKIKAFPELELPLAQIEILQNVLNQLITGRPIQYILGKTSFYGLCFNVNQLVLIPRPETEELVEWVLFSVGSRLLAVDSSQLAAGNILDIGTGSGCIAISLKKHLPDFKVSAIDISAGALQVAKQNAELNDVNIEFIRADILNLKSEIAHPSFEIIISNPPYVTAHDKTQMHVNVTDFEPHTALFVPEDDPLIFYKAIADFAVTHLIPRGLLFFEINESYGKEIVELLTDKGFKKIELKKDINGNDRMIKASLV